MFGNLYEEPRLTKTGCLILTSFFGSWSGRDRYHYDTTLLKLGYRQYDTDQDAWYFGIWVHLEWRVIVTWVEGEEVVKVAGDQESFIAQLRSMGEFYGPTPAHIRAYHDDGTVTHYIDTRPGTELLAQQEEDAA